MVNYDFLQAKDILKQNNTIKLTLINMANQSDAKTYDFDPSNDGYQIMEILIKNYNPVGKYYNLYRDPNGYKPIFYEELSNPVKNLNLGINVRIWYRLDDDMKTQF
jgi:hypothetical protein